MSRRNKEKRRRKEERELLTKREIEARETARAKRLKLILAIVAIVAAVAILAVVVISIVSAVLNSARINYESDDLSQYIYISRDDYMNYKADITANAIDDVTIDSALLRSLAKYRAAPTGSESRWFYPNSSTVLGVGDAIRFYYYGYTLDEDGNKIPFDGGSNIYSFTGDAQVDDTSAKTYIGEGKYIDGFELGLVGKKPTDYSGLNLITDRPIAEGDFISVTTSITPPDASKAQQSVTLLVRLDPESADSVYGVGFMEKFIGKNAGDKVESFVTDNCYGEKGKTVFTNVKINYIYDLGDNPLTVMGRFPVDYSAENLAGKICYFDIYVKQYNDYTMPLIDEAFVTEKLGLSLDEFNLYEGESVYEKYRSMIKEQVMEEDEAAIRGFVEKIMWDVYSKKLVVKYIPAGDINEYYEDYLYEIESGYQSESTTGSVSTLDAYAISKLGLKSGDDWRAYLRSTAQARIAERVVFYYVLRAEGLMPTEDEIVREYNKLIDEYIVSYLSYYGKGTTPADYPSIEAYNKAWADAKAGVLAVYDEDYMRENAIFNIGIGRLVSLADKTVTRGTALTPEEYTTFPLV